MRDSTNVATGPAAQNRRYVKEQCSAIPRGTWKSISNRRRHGKRKIDKVKILRAARDAVPTDMATDSVVRNRRRLG